MKGRFSLAAEDLATGGGILGTRLTSFKEREEGFMSEQMILCIYLLDDL